MEYFLRLWPLLLLLLTTGEKMTALISTTVRALLLLRNLNFWTYYIRSVYVRTTTLCTHHHQQANTNNSQKKTSTKKISKDKQIIRTRIRIRSKQALVVDALTTGRFFFTDRIVCMKTPINRQLRNEPFVDGPKIRRTLKCVIYYYPKITTNEEENK